MAKLTVINHVTLDGVMQAPARPDEDRPRRLPARRLGAALRRQRHGRVHGQGHGEGGALLFGRRTYEDFAAVWPQQEGNPVSALLNERRKYVASTTLREPLPWVNSTLLQGDIAEAVAGLKEDPGEDLGVLGSGELVQLLMRHGLVDEYVLTIHPLVLGSGRRLFADDGPLAALRLVESKPTTTGVVIAVYQPA